MMRICLVNNYNKTKIIIKNNIKDKTKRILKEY